MQTQLINVVEAEVLKRMRARQSFTALDISNALKTERYPFRHREVAEVVRDIHESGAMDFYDFQRQLIPVTTDGGAKTAQAYLYYHREVRPGDYIARNQTALPLVAPGQARDLTDSAPATYLGLLPRPTPPAPSHRRQNSRSRRCGGRRDGALPIPHRLIAQLGWKPGSQFALKAEPGCLTISSDTGDEGSDVVRVWGGQRVRVCKTKLRLGALSADVAFVEIVGDGLRIQTQP